MRRFWLAAAIFAICGPAANAQYQVTPKYYIGIDSRVDLTGTYAGLINPNYNRLTFLYAHTFATNPANNHFHRVGAFVYTGPNLGINTATTFGNPVIPEGINSTNRLTLIPTGTGIFASGMDTGNPYEGINISTTRRLTSFAAGTPEHFLINSSVIPAGAPNAGLPRYNITHVDNANLAIELVSITAGLEVSLTAGGASLFSGVGSRYALGTGSQLATNSFNPVFWTGNPQTLSTQFYEAKFRIVDTSGNFAASGEFSYRFAQSAAPEPGALALMALGVCGLLAARRRSLPGGNA